MRLTGFENDPHSERGSACPRNCFGYTSYADLHRVENTFVTQRGHELMQCGITGKFDSEHLRKLHWSLFHDIFPWAGQFRVVNISKSRSTFALAMHVEAALEEALAKLRREHLLQALDRVSFIERASYYLGEINAIHPFREGNGRTQREFIRQLALSAGHPLIWAGFTQEQMVAASILSHARGDNTGLATIIEAAISKDVAFGGPESDTKE